MLGGNVGNGKVATLLRNSRRHTEAWEEEKQWNNDVQEKYIDHTKYRQGEVELDIKGMSKPTSISSKSCVGE